MSFLVSSGCVAVRGPLTFTHIWLTSLLRNRAYAAFLTPLRGQLSHQTLPRPVNRELTGGPVSSRGQTHFLVASCCISALIKVRWRGNKKEMKHRIRGVWCTVPAGNSEFSSSFNLHFITAVCRFQILTGTSVKKNKKSEISCCWFCLPSPPHLL